MPKHGPNEGVAFPPVGEDPPPCFDIFLMPRIHADGGHEQAMAWDLNEWPEGQANRRRVHVDSRGRISAARRVKSSLTSQPER